MEECKEDWAQRVAQGDADAEDHLESCLHEQRAHYKASYPRIAAKGPLPGEEPSFDGTSSRGYQGVALPREEEQAELIPRSYASLKQVRRVSCLNPD